MNVNNTKKYFLVLLVAFLAHEARARRIYHGDNDADLLIYGTTDKRDYFKDDDPEKWLQTGVSKRALGPTGARIVRAALITAGVIHVASLVISTAKLGFDIWFEQHKCCGIHKSICDDYKDYKRIKDEVFVLSADIDREYLIVENTETYLFSLSRLNTHLYESMKNIDYSMEKLVMSLDSDLIVKLRTAKHLLKDNLSQHNKSLSNLTYVTLIMDGVFKDIFNNVLRASAFFSDVYMLYWARNTWKNMNVLKGRPRSTVVTSRAGINLNPNFVQRAGWYIKGHYKRALTTVTVGATSVLTVYASVQDILYFIKTIEACNDIRDGMRKALNEWKPKKNQTKELHDDVIALKKNVTDEYNILKSSLYSTNFTDFTREVIKLMENASNASELKSVGAELLDFNNKITTADFSLTETLVTQATKAFDKVKHKLDCLTKKFNTLNYAVFECKKGSASIHQLFLNAQKQEVKDAKDCVENGYMTEADVTGWVSQKMKETGYQADCLLNDQDKKDLVCDNWVNGLTDEANAADQKLSLTQVKWFIEVSKCPPAELINDTKTAICFEKDKGTSLAETLVAYIKYNLTQTEAAYNVCQLSASRMELICRDKNDGYALVTIAAKHSLYGEAMVKSVYDNCPLPKITPMAKKFICLYKKLGVGPSDPDNADFVKTYGLEQVQAAYDACPENDSSTEANAEKYRDLYHSKLNRNRGVKDEKRFDVSLNNDKDDDDDFRDYQDNDEDDEDDDDDDDMDTKKK